PGVDVVDHVGPVAPAGQVGEEGAGAGQRVDRVVADVHVAEVVDLVGGDRAAVRDPEPGVGDGVGHGGRAARSAATAGEVLLPALRRLAQLGTLGEHRLHLLPRLLALVGDELPGVVALVGPVVLEVPAGHRGAVHLVGPAGPALRSGPGLRH